MCTILSILQYRGWYGNQDTRRVSKQILLFQKDNTPNEIFDCIRDDRVSLYNNKTITQHQLLSTCSSLLYYELKYRQTVIIFQLLHIYTY